eukprot:TRINITY_DN150649_c0_g1_i2.p1 TRINITY_DN150649_c0_g1~~TRINITY_DN150649_c0_g1_i2.p1  ORF type:complete len:152 (-),score=14.34 TRINITY_DN150649_c0_g1_i2:450-905(-)
MALSDHRIDEYLKKSEPTAKCVVCNGLCDKIETSLKCAKCGNWAHSSCISHDLINGSFTCSDCVSKQQNHTQQQKVRKTKAKRSRNKLSDTRRVTRSSEPSKPKPPVSSSQPITTDVDTDFYEFWSNLKPYFEPSQSTFSLLESKSDGVSQ